MALHSSTVVPHWFRAGVVAALVVLLFPGTVRAAAADASAASRAQLETELGDARERLDDAARDVADLTRKLYGDEPHDVLRFVGRPPRGSMLGVNIDSGDTSGEGVRIVGVSPGGPAAEAGLRPATSSWPSTASRSHPRPTHRRSSSSTCVQRSRAPRSKSLTCEAASARPSS
jgi:hypothetical protein